MSRTITLQFFEEGIAENPFPPRSWAFVPSVGDSVLLPETGRRYRVQHLEWRCTAGRTGGTQEEELHVLVRVVPLGGA